jgi:hypothetical protein
VRKRVRSPRSEDHRTKSRCLPDDVSTLSDSRKLEGCGATRGGLTGKLANEHCRTVVQLSELEQKVKLTRCLRTFHVMPRMIQSTPEELRSFKGPQPATFTGPTIEDAGPLRTSNFKNLTGQKTTHRSARAREEINQA